jgi:antitoxin component of RelBE/YafQ-DinJ toxin-antitoxin module
MPKQTHTPLRNIRVPDDVWNAAKESAERNGTNLSEVIRAFLVRYGKK